MKNIKILLIGLSLFASSGIVFSGTNNTNENIRCDATSENDAYRVVAYAYWWALQPKYSCQCTFTIKDSKTSDSSYVTSTKNDFNTDKSDYRNYICDFYTNTIPGYYSFEVITNKKISKTLGFVYQIFYKGECIYHNGGTELGESYGFTAFSSGHTFSGSPSILNDSYHYVLDNSYANNQDQLLNNFDIYKNKHLPNISSQAFVQPDGSVKTTTNKPTSSNSDIVFAGYFGTDSLDNTYEMYYDSNCVPVKTNNLNRNTTIKAMFKNNIDFNTNGGQFVEARNNAEKMMINDRYYLIGEQFKLPNPVRSGYTFMGWTGSNGEDPTLDVVIPTDCTSGISYIANWKADEYSISYDLQGGQELIPNPSSYYYETPTFTLNYPIREGYVFIGWTGTGLSSPTMNVTIQKYSFGDREYIANWEIKKYSIKFNTGDGGSLIPSQSIEHGGNVVEPQNPTRELDGIRYSFIQWNYLDGDILVKFDFTTPIYDNLTLYADWICFVDQFVTNYMHPEVPDTDKGTGLCITSGWYNDAKIAFNILTQDEKNLFLYNDNYKTYSARLLAWANANGDVYDGNMLTNSSDILSLSNGNFSFIVVLFTSCTIACTMTALIVVLKRRKCK